MMRLPSRVQPTTWSAPGCDVSRLRNAARGGNYVYIFIAIIFAGEGDHRAIGRKERVDLDADVARKLTGLAAIAVHDPQVAAVAEGNLRFANGRLAQKRVRVAGLRRQLRRGKQEQENSEQSHRKLAEREHAELSRHQTLRGHNHGSLDAKKNGMACALLNQNNQQESITGLTARSRALLDGFSWGRR